MMFSDEITKVINKLHIPHIIFVKFLSIWKKRLVKVRKHQLRAKERLTFSLYIRKQEDTCAFSSVRFMSSPEPLMVLLRLALSASSSFICEVDAICKRRENGNHEAPIKIFTFSEWWINFWRSKTQEICKIQHYFHQTRRKQGKQELLMDITDAFGWNRTGVLIVVFTTERLTGVFSPTGGIFLIFVKLLHLYS